MSPTRRRPVGHRYTSRPVKSLGAKAVFVIAYEFDEESFVFTREPDSIQAGIWKTLTLGRLGRHDEAVALLRKLPWADDSTYEEYAVEVVTRAGLQAEAERAYA